MAWGYTVRHSRAGGKHATHVIAGLIRNPQGQCHGAAVILALRQYPQGGGDGTVSFSPSPLIPLPSRERGYGCIGLLAPSPLIPLHQGRGGFGLVGTLTFDSSPIKGEGIMLVGVVLLSPSP